MDVVVLNMGSLASLLSSLLVLFAGVWCIRKTLRFINRSK